MKAKTDIVQFFQEKLAHIQIDFDKHRLKEYGNDSSSYFEANSSLIVYPKTTQEVVEIVQLANQEKIFIVPSGGRTGLSGGATALNNEVILSLEKLNREIQFNEEEQTLEVEAGMITQVLQEKAKERDLYFPIDFAAVGSSQIGGNIATNAGGIHVIHYGMIRDWITGLKVVTGKGEVLNLNKGLIKNNTGYDLKNLFIGSEGTLGVITEATIQLTQKPQQPCTFLFSFDKLQTVLELFKWFKSEVDLLAFEFFTDEALQYALNEGGVEFAMENRAPFYVIIEFEKLRNTSIHLKEEMEHYIINKVFDLNLIQDGIVALSDEDRIRIWKHRENIPAAINRFNPYKNDISVRIHKVPQFIKELDALLKKEYPNLEVLWFGHIGDGNLHINLPKPETLLIEDFRKQCDQASMKIYQLIEKFNGSISAEHGVGLIKKKYLHFTRSQEEIEYMKQIKTLFDPNHILNPGKIF
ncbi:D-2-hydroxyglutarate dehydrogenase [Flavobacteriaceae bacterium UJ101]|nr:D-2-hydroxyglutarate dehydrogenase [Flavobacteriaceae bacterium UJ101]